MRKLERLHAGRWEGWARGAGARLTEGTGIVLMALAVVPILAFAGGTAAPVLLRSAGRPSSLLLAWLVCAVGVSIALLTVREDVRIARGRLPTRTGPTLVILLSVLAPALGLLGLALGLYLAGTAFASGASDPDTVQRDLHGVLFWGGMAVVLGLLGTVVGVVVAMEAIARAGEARASLVWGGVGVSLVTLIFGLVIFIVAAVAWFALRQWHAAVTTAAGMVLMPLIASGALLASSTIPVSAQTPEWQVSEKLRVGPPSAEFASITDVALDESGRLWIVDGMAGELWVEESGEPRRVARSGQGPGELSPGRIEIVRMPGDTMLVVEPQSWRLHRFTADGAFVRSGRIEGEAGLTGQWHRVPGGGLAARIYPASVGGPGAPGEGGPVRAFDLEGRAGEILAMLPPMESFRMGRPVADSHPSGATAAVEHRCGRPGPGRIDPCIRGTGHRARRIRRYGSERTDRPEADGSGSGKKGPRVAPGDLDGTRDTAPRRGADGGSGSRRGARDGAGKVARRTRPYRVAPAGRLMAQNSWISSGREPRSGRFTTSAAHGSPP